MRKASSVIGLYRKGFKIKLITHYALRVTIFLLFTIHYPLFTASAFAEYLNLQSMIEEALGNNHEVLMAEAKWKTGIFRIPQAKSLPDPMFMFGYQNEGTRDLYTFGDEMSSQSQWMFSASQMFPFPGKLSLKGEMAVRDAEALKASYDSIRLKTIAKIKELYYELFLAHKNIDLIKDKNALFLRIEDSAITRYSAGMAEQQEVLMIQTEKYMLMEKEEMLRQKIQSIEAMLNASVGSDVNLPLNRPSEPAFTIYEYSMDELIKMTYQNSPEIKTKERMVAGAETGVRMAEREYYPDFTLNAGYFATGSAFPDMWSFTTTINIPLFYRTKQKQAVFEAKAALSDVRHELEAVKLMLSSALRDNYSMSKTAERLMELYKDALIPKTYQDFESALAGYAAGKAEALTVISRLKSLIDFELLYWQQFIEREKAIARLEAITAVNSN